MNFVLLSAECVIRDPLGRPLERGARSLRLFECVCVSVPHGLSSTIDSR